MKRRLLFHVFFVSCAYYLSNGLYMVRGLLLAWLLGPAVFGVWTGMRMLQSLTVFAHLGTRQGMVQLAPLAEGGGDHQRADLLARNASGVNLLSGITVSLLIAAIAGVFAEWRAAWMIFALALVTVQLLNFYHSFFRARQQFTLAGSGEVLVAVITTVLGLPAAWRFGLVGFLVVLAVANAATLLVLWRLGPAYPPPTLDRATTRQLLRTGFPLMASGGLFTLMWNVDKLLLWVIRGSESLGIYAVQSSFTVVALLAPTALGVVLHPHLMRHLGEHRTPESLRPYLVRGGELVAAWSAPIAALGCVVLHLPIRWWLARYADAIAPGRVLMLGAYFSMMATVPMVVTIALNGQRTLCMIRLIAIAVAVVAGYVGLQHSYTGLALGMSAALVVDGLLTQRQAMRRALVHGGAAAGLAVRMLCPFIVLAASAWLAWRLVPEVTASWQADVIATAQRAAIVVVPCVAWASWRSLRLELLR